MKKSLIIIFFVFILISTFFFLSAATHNTKEYDSVNKVVTIKDSSGNVISDITLNTPLVFNVIRGKDRKVAEFTIDNKLSSQPISSVLEKLDFYDVKNSMKRFDRQFNYKYRNSLGFETVNDYKTVCVDGEISSNGTILRDCSQVLIGTHQEEMFEWNDLNSLGTIPSGKTIIGIFTDVLPNERVEWVPTLLGVEVNEWAEWTESMNTDIIAYYRLNGTSGNVIDATGNITGSNNGAARGQTGIINASFNFTAGDSDYVNLTDMLDIGTDIGSGFTISFWLNTIQEAGTQPTPWGKEVSGGNPRMGIFLNAQKTTGHENGTIMFFYWDGSGNGLSGDFGAPNNTWRDGNWHHVAVTMTPADNNITFHVDGILYTTDYAAQSTPSNFITLGDSLTLGAFNFAGTINRFFDGSLDEVGFWNRSLTTSEISDLYNCGEGITYRDVF
ncbi:MAG: LamG domain-containing protein [Nanoarchaeota archaeon]|nr:LamG domain-containing protein [Nanoarchaeota archaeon]